MYIKTHHISLLYHPHKEDGHLSCPPTVSTTHEPLSPACSPDTLKNS